MYTNIQEYSWTRKLRPEPLHHSVLILVLNHGNSKYVRYWTIGANCVVRIFEYARSLVGSNA